MIFLSNLKLIQKIIYTIFVLIVSYLFIIDYANAEYRVFQFYVKPKIQIQDENQAYLVTSSLDPKSYLYYHGGTNSLEVDTVRTWICPGNTGNYKEYCKSPYQKVLELTKK